MHRLNHTRTFKKDEYQNGVPMNKEILTKLFSNGSEVMNILNTLERMKFIKKTRIAIINLSSAKYQLHEEISNENVLQVPFHETDSALIRKLNERNNDNKSFKDQLLMLRNSVTINNLGKEYLISKYNSSSVFDGDFAVASSDFGLKAIYNGHFFAKRRDIKSRVYTNLTQLSRDHRKYIEINGKPMLMTDISNSQILLTVPLLHKYWAKKSGKGMINLPDDVNAFQKLAESGTFYECIADSAGKTFSNPDDRADFKKKVFEEIWFSKNYNRLTAIKKAFKNKFPTVFDIIWRLKEEKHNEFAIKLQRFEASILVDKVWKKMFKLGRTVFTLHDAIICTSVDDLELAEELISDELIKFRIKPKFKRENEDVNRLVA